LKEYLSAAKRTRKEALQAKAWDLWLDCCATQREIAKQLDVVQQTICDWLDRITANADFRSPPVSRQHFDIWQFQRSCGRWRRMRCMCPHAQRGFVAWFACPSSPPP
jgi:hypothetical protein